MGRKKNILPPDDRSDDLVLNFLIDLLTSLVLDNEKVFQLEIRNYSHCINLIKVVKEFYPNLNSYKLSEIEKKFGFHRAAKKYKADIFSIYKDWNDPKLRKLVLKYNKEDVYNLARVKQRIFAENKIPKEYMQRIRLS